MLNALVVMVTLVEYVMFFPEIVKIYKICQQQGLLRVKIEDSLRFSLCHYHSVVENKIFKHKFLFLSCKLLLSSPQVSQ